MNERVRSLLRIPPDTLGGVIFFRDERQLVFWEGEVGTCIGAENTGRENKREREKKSRANSHRWSEIFHPPPENTPKTSSKGAPDISSSGRA